MKTSYLEDYPGYRFHDNGSVWSCHNNKWGLKKSWKQLKPGTNNKYGRTIVCLKHASGKIQTRYVHQLILAAFRGPIPEGHESLHKNGHAGDNRLSNLRYGTREENLADARKHGRHKGEKHHLSTLTDKIIRNIRVMRKTGMTQQSIADELGIKRRNVGRILDGSRWGHVK